MARNYILGGMAGTQLQAGKPFFKRIVRIDGRGQTPADPNKVPARADGLTCNIDNDGKINFNNALPADWNANTQHGVQNVDPDHKGGELLMVEFPTTLRSVQIQLEEASDKVRAKIMLTAPGQDTKADGTANLASPVADGNYIEIKSGETATISSRTKVVFILIQKYADAKIFNGAALTVGDAGAAADAASILVTGVLDHEPISGGSQAANEPNSIVIDANGDERSLRKIWGATDGIG